MPPGDVRFYPHIFDPTAVVSRDFKTPRPGRGKALSLQARDRASHAAHLLAQLDQIEETAQQRIAEQKAEGVDAGNGIYLQFESEPGFDLKFESLEFSPSGIELCAVKKSDNRTQATVFVPDGKLAFFLKRITDYRDADTAPDEGGIAKPKNKDMVESVSVVRLAVLEALWTDERRLLPNFADDAMWEVWLRKSDQIDHLERLRGYAVGHNLTVSQEAIPFVDRIIVLVYGKGRDLARSADILGSIAELRLAKTTADFFTRMSTIDQQTWVYDLAGRLQQPPANAPYVCLFDTGLNNGHPLLQPVAHNGDLHTYRPEWNVDDRWGTHGHGTSMAGIAVYGDLTDALASQGPWQLTHRLESVKVFSQLSPHPIELYGAVTIESANRVEVIPDRKRVYCMAISTTDSRDRGRPSSWSASIDALTSGAADRQRRLMVLSAGNTDLASRRDYPNSNLTDGVHDPGQAWNAITVGGYTEKALVDQARYPGWEALASPGDLAPCACTSLTWKGTKWPYKPDIVLEAGNMARHADHTDPDYIDDALQLLSTPRNFVTNRPLTTFGDTSAAAAAAARFAAMLWAKYPRLTPEAVRALIIHSATWTAPMVQRFTYAPGEVDYDGLMRCFGYGVPNQRRLLSSADNSLTLIAQGSIQPFYKEGSDVKYRELKLHGLPWPVEILQQLGETEVQLRVTLSYFVEPNPGDRGWTTKYGYQSHGLRFAVKRARETVQQFEKRINKAARENNYDGDHRQESGSWQFNQTDSLMTSGSVHSNLWTGTAADLAARGHVAIFPTYGWWNKRPNLKAYDKISHYALVVTITTPETDIYTSVASQIRIPIIIETGLN
jgi:hypothetical protein